MIIGKIVKSDSHIDYVCQVFGPGEVEEQPEPGDYTFGRFVRVPLRLPQGRTETTRWGVEAQPPIEALSALVSSRPAPDAIAGWAVGVIYDTILLNPAFGALGPRLSNGHQTELFSPDYLSERAVLVYFLVLGGMYERSCPATPVVSHGILPTALELGCEVEILNGAGVRDFHLFADNGKPGGSHPYLHMGYLPHVLSQRNPLLQMATLHIIEQLESLFPQNAALLSIVKANFSWKLKVETTG